MKGKKTEALLMSCAMLLSSLPLAAVSAEEAGPKTNAVQTYADDGSISFAPEGYTILDDGKFIDFPKSNLLAWADTSQPGDSTSPSMMIDGNVNTKWEAEWSGSGNTVVTIELTSPAYVYGFV